MTPLNSTNQGKKMNNCTLAHMTRDTRIKAVQYVSKIQNPILSRIGVLPVVLLDTAGYLIQSPLNAYQNLGATISYTIDCLCFQSEASTNKIVFDAEDTLISLTNTAAKAITVIPLALCHAAKGLSDPTKLTAIDHTGKNKSFSDALARGYTNQTKTFVEDSILQPLFNNLFSKQSIFNNIIKRPTSILFVTVDRVAKIAYQAFQAIKLALRSFDSVTFCFTQERQPLVTALLQFTAALQLAGICASKIVSSPLYLANHYVINLLMPPAQGYSA